MNLAPSRRDDDELVRIGQWEGSTSAFPLAALGYAPYVSVYRIDVIRQPQGFRIAIERSGKVRSLVSKYFERETASAPLQKWAATSHSILLEIIPSINPPVIPTHFIQVGLLSRSDDIVLFKAALGLGAAKNKPDEAAAEMGGFIHWYFCSRLNLSSRADLEKPQDWILNCLVVKWKKLRGSSADTE